MNKRYRSEALAAGHKTALDLTEAGVMTKLKMREFDDMCLTPVDEPVGIRKKDLGRFVESIVMNQN